MKTTKITNTNGMYSVVGPRNELNFVKTSFISSTEPQPFVAANFDADGNEIGGRTMTQSEVDRLLQVAGENGLTIEIVE